MRPVEEPIVATEELPLVQVPPLVASLSKVVAATKALAGPVMGAMRTPEFTWTDAVTKQPVDNI
jgi:hypothetical protein